jgi:hypothetical protein
VRRILLTWLGVVLAVVLVGLLILSPWLHAKSPPNPGDGTANKASLMAALTGTNMYYQGHHDSYLGLDVGNLGVITDISAVAGADPSPGTWEVSLFAASSTTVVITDYWPGGKECLGILSVEKPLARPYFPRYPITAKVGRYYFVASSGSSCAAASVVPAPTANGQVGLSAVGFGGLADGG